MTYKVTITDLLKPVVPEEAILKENGASLVYGDSKTEAELIELTHDADAIISVYIPITSNVVSKLERCQVIVRRGIGFDNVDIAAATAKGIPVANVPDFCIDEVADHTTALLLCLARRIAPAMQQTKSGKWSLKEFQPLPALKDCTLGLIGFGKIPRAVAERAKSFGLNIITSDPFIPAEVAAEHGAKMVSLEELLSSSDFVSVHAPLTQETRGMISTKQFAMMKPSAVLINTARGPVVDEKALIEALQNGEIAYTALDVMEKEPPAPDNPLLRMDNAIVTPHLAWYSDHSAKEAGIRAASEIVRVFKGYFPKSLVNPGVIELRHDLKKA